jgi:CheY-like chemotaxis protein
MKPTTYATPEPLILVIEDDPEVQAMLQEVLADEGYRTLLLSESASAVELIQATQPDLVVLDLWLERADAGWMVLNQLHRTIGTRTLPIVVCSANPVMLTTLAEVHPAPNYAFLAKPLDTTILLEIIAHLLGRTTP